MLWGVCSSQSLDSGLVATAVEVSKSLHNLTTKPLIQNLLILFQDVSYKHQHAHALYSCIIIPLHTVEITICIALWFSLSLSVTRNTLTDLIMPQWAEPQRQTVVVVCL